MAFPSGDTARGRLILLFAMLEARLQPPSTQVNGSISRNDRTACA